MNFYLFAPNLYIEDHPSFGNYNREIIFDLLRSVDVNFSRALGLTPFSSRRCYIVYHNEHPMCSGPSEEYHLIHLHTYDNYWCKWIYQFSHEYCHHLINGKLSGELTGLIWFEETICELSSMYHLLVLYLQWSTSSNPIQSQYAPAFRDYLNDLLSQNLQLLSLTERPGWLSSWIPVLLEPEYHRDYYNAIAAKILPLFVENPSLWMIILHMGDTRKWESLQSLFDYLFETAEASYSDSLHKFYHLLFS